MEHGSQRERERERERNKEKKKKERKEKRGEKEKKENVWRVNLTDTYPLLSSPLLSSARSALDRASERGKKKKHYRLQ